MANFLLVIIVTAFLNQVGARKIAKTEDGAKLAYLATVEKTELESISTLPVSCDLLFLEISKLISKLLAIILEAITGLSENNPDTTEANKNLKKENTLNGKNQFYLFADWVVSLLKEAELTKKFESTVLSGDDLQEIALRISNNQRKSDFPLKFVSNIYNENCKILKLIRDFIKTIIA